MVNDPHPDRPAGRDGRVHRIWPGPARAGDIPPVLDLGFDLDTLHTARARLRAFLSRAGLPEGRAEDVVLAAHELAANAVSHGGGAGRLRVWNLAGALYCQVDDGAFLTSAGPGAGHDDIAAARPESSHGQASLNALPCESGHGLWVVRQVADHVQSLSGPAGTSVLIRFDRGVTRPSA
jgi:anti-sigma regulatory factor (Ser/Thr protein kinase)